MPGAPAPGKRGLMFPIPGMQGMPVMPPMPGFPSLSTSTSSGAQAGNQSGGSFVSHGINFGTASHGAAASGNALLIWGAVALAAYWLVIRKK